MTGTPNPSMQLPAGHTGPSFFEGSPGPPETGRGVRQDGGMRVTLSKIAALAVSIGLVVATFVLERSWSLALTVAVGTLLLLALIWFPEFFGSLTGWGRRAPIDRPSPPLLVAALGWLLLLGLPILALVSGWIGR